MNEPPLCSIQHSVCAKQDGEQLLDPRRDAPVGRLRDVPPARLYRDLPPHCVELYSAPSIQHSVHAKRDGEQLLDPGRDAPVGRLRDVPPARLYRDFPPHCVELYSALNALEFIIHHSSFIIHKSNSSSSGGSTGLFAAHHSSHFTRSKSNRCPVSSRSESRASSE